MLPVNHVANGLICFVVLLGTVTAIGQELSDPTLPPQQLQPTTGAAQVPSSGLRLQSIQFMGNKRSALINGQRVYEKEPFGQYVIEKIDMNFVILRHQQTSQAVTLRLFGLSKKAMNISGTDL